MPKGKKFAGRDWKPGQSGNPKGRARTPPELKEARKQTRQDVEALVLKYKNMTQAELEAVMKNAATPAEEILVIRVILRGIAKGDASTLLFLTDFLFGKKPEAIRLDHTSSDKSMTPGTVIVLPAKDASKD